MFTNCFLILSSTVITALAMSTAPLSEVFRLNIFFWKIFGLWPGKIPTKYYKYYSVSYLIVMLFIYNLLLTLSLIYTPRELELLIREVIFYFTEVALTFKVIMILVMRNEILAAFDTLDCEVFKSDDDTGKKIIEQNVKNYKTYWKSYAILCNFVYLALVFIPVATYLILNSKLDLPICQYYFLSPEIRDKFFALWYIYLSLGMFGHMMCNVSVDSFIAGLIIMAITQLKVINHELTSLELDSMELKRATEVQEKIQVTKLTKCLRHYDLILKYCSSVQKIISVTMFVQFGMTSAVICVVMCGLLLLSTNDILVFLVSYFIAMTCQIFVPAWLGTQLSHESREVVDAAYNSQWIPRSEGFKRSLRILMTRANKPIVLTGLKMLSLSLGTFTSIMKTAYSCFTLVLKVQERQEQN